MRSTQVNKKLLKDYQPFVEEEVIESIIELSRELKGLRVLHVNATSFGGGVAEILHTLVPLMKDCGLEVDWKVIDAPPQFFDLTKRMHNALQGKEDFLSEEDKRLFEKVAKDNAAYIGIDEYDVAVLHDPQPVGLPAFANFGNCKLVWRCHIDTSSPNEVFWNYLNTFLSYYDAGIFTLKSYAKDGIAIEKIYDIPPSIDPLSNKNRMLSEEEMKKAMTKLGLVSGRPVIAQVSRFDPWKDPMGVVDAYRQLKRKFPDLQLLLIGSMASDDPEGWKIYEDLLRYIGMDYDVKVLSNFHGIGDIEVNAAQRISKVVLQKSLREGFALTMSEAMWKKTPVIGGNVGGIPLQVHHGVNGYLVESVDETVEYTERILENPDLAKELGRNGYEIVKKHFLCTRHLLQYLELFRDLTR
ncbi:glycosyl transferase family 1 [Mesotoga sp. HF07.pep.5.2.highcov]|jgi:trehalose synthase|uniref:Glycosyltransferase n=1 Tax=Mesotoga prima MesG1.Ag.4.2 TaxID=660470 RepID=I2F2L2_9BACT|nr:MULTISPECIES: glycosyltransferase [Mesotoga]AFK06165.1 glycosyltransferase [Mesotoga prima MesG1.Ag.4.2]MDK2943432.1 trehalose synthase [Mesotoga sp.]PIJ61976.1 glycosyl transferase family 1 [Mesotoga sp. H07.pep.5.3]RLL92098.1 glycosyl transferase family 1 [Mesotoga sp. HF07.pep.5.2.highcov]